MRKGFALLLILALVLSIATLSFVVWRYYSPQKPNTNHLKTLQKDSNLIGSEFLIIADSELGIEFKYPSDWQHIKDVKGSQMKFDPHIPMAETSNELVTDNKGCALYISSDGGSEGPTDYWKESSINIDSKSFTQRSWSKTEGGNGIFNYYFSDTYKTKVDPLVIWSWTPNINCQVKIDQILSTFKFIE